MMAVADNLFIINNSSLQNLNGLNNMKEVRNGLQIAGNDMLQNIDAIGQMLRVGGAFVILDNKELTSLMGIEDISLEGAMLYIADNDKLNTCHAENVCNYLDLFSGQAFINNNKAGCMTIPEVNNHCALLALPVELVAFEAMKKGDDSALRWTTANEYNNKGFEVMRSVDAQNWEKVDWVPAKSNGSSENVYKYLDQHGIKGDVYYRIDQVDIDDAKKVSDIKFLKFGYEKSSLSVFPNPAINKVTIEYQSDDFTNGKVEIGLFDLTGKSRKFARTDQSDLIELDLQGLPNGYYTLIVNGSSSKLMILGETK